MTKGECAVIMAYTGVCMLKDDDLGRFYGYIAKLMGRPVFSHELAGEAMAADIKARAKPDFVRLCLEATDDR